MKILSWLSSIVTTIREVNAEVAAAEARLLEARAAVEQRYPELATRSGRRALDSAAIVYIKRLAQRGRVNVDDVTERLPVIARGLVEPPTTPRNREIAPSR